MRGTPRGPEACQLFFENLCMIVNFVSISIEDTTSYQIQIQKNDIQLELHGKKNEII